MSVLWRIDYESDNDWQAASGRAKTVALKAAMLAMATMWQKQYLPMHFLPGNAQRYHYQPRKPKYLQRKMRAGDTTKNAHGRSRASFTKVAGGGLIDLVYRGLLRRLILKQSTVRGFPNRATVYLVGPDYFTLRPRRPERPNLAREILVILDSERKALRFEATTTFYEALRKSPRRGRPKKT
jgi:hypothetical protein